MYNPVSTYRIQFHKGFNFKEFEAVIPYLSKLGIKTIYASPIFKAVPGSMHGYDVTDPLTINPEIGTLSELRRISKKLRKLGIGWLQDIVPNHMAFNPANSWLMDVLKKGKKSRYSGYFDILWEDKLMVPFLGSSFDDALAEGEITITGAGKLNYMGQHYPLTKKTAGPITDKVHVKAIAEAQHYRLCSWEETNYHINYRRFFTVNGLICLNMQDAKVFETYHGLIAKLITEGIFHGLRVDHIDGLHDPETYLNRLRELTSDDTYIITEKILEPGEQFPNWPIQGNTGYDMLSLLNNLFTNKKSEKQLNAFYNSLHTGKAAVSQRIADKKRLILEKYMPGELENLYQLFPMPEIGVKEAIAELMILFPVYRLYGNSYPLPESEAGQMRELLAKVKAAKPELADAAEMIEYVLLKKMSPQALKFYQRLMQFTGPLMAKGVEDTLMYTYDRFIVHNEVGDSPGAFGLKIKTFHRLMARRLENWPLSMTATATHDTKRGEDVRARLNVLSDMTESWLEQVEHWRKAHAKLKKNNYPDANDEYFIYQTIIGALPMPGQDEDDFGQRLNDYLVKALREGKVNSDWAKPNEAYENAAMAFAAAVTTHVGASPFFKQVADLGIINSLAQVLLKYTLPGVPDLYQGCESWDLSFVDPDNRRPVDHKKHSQFLGVQTNVDELWDSRYNGRIKQRLTRLFLQERAANPQLFTGGEYIPLETKGKYRKNILAFARNSGTSWLVTVVALHPAEVSGDWQDTRILLPQQAPRNWHNLLTDEKGYAARSITVTAIFKNLPLALVKLSADDTSRTAGILMHITSLPSPFGIGDIGPAAYAFADFLAAARQKYWQMLPVGSVGQQTDYSPYSAKSSTTANTLLISPELLVSSGWLDETDLNAYRLPLTGRAEPELAEINKGILFDQAYRNAHTTVDKDQWLQGVFNAQWQALKRYCNDKGIRLIGDLPFYMSADAADVKDHPELFKTDSLAGVPPDYFSKDGQLWGMPVYNWPAHQAQKYEWWVQRIKKNLEYFDLLRLDHFRAFVAYWEVPAGAETAAGGNWEPGPGKALFDQLKRSLGSLPFIAEDLGEITDDVYQLRDELDLPGMRVLQFAFDEAMAISPHIPHNYEPGSVAYTGTHDNNTIKGWYKELDKSTKSRLKKYTHQKVNRKNAHRVLIELVYASAAGLAIVPLQDVLGLAADAKMNDPGKKAGNWRWQLTAGMLNKKTQNYLVDLVINYNR